ncbi:MAG: hypothetical protein QNL33_08515 [Akkermansiaceae bacterium]|jgi:hypothetical protein
MTDDQAGLSFSFDYRYRHNQDIYRGSSELKNPADVSTTFQQYSLSGAWKVNDELILRASLPFTNAVREENGAPDSTINGVGDAAISALFKPWSGDDSILGGVGFTFGLVLPTGEAKDQPRVGIASPSVFQLGTGTTQLTLGAQYAAQFDDWSFLTFVQTTVPLDESSKGFRPAETVFLSAGIGRPITDKLSARFSLDLFHGGRDEVDGLAISNTGSTTLSLSPSIVYRLRDDFAISGSVSLPLYRDVNQTQLVAAPLWSLGLNYSF